MKKFLKKYHFYFTSFFLFSLILASFYWIFKDSIKQAFPEKVIVEIGNSEVGKKMKVPRKVSYLGRIREAEKLIDQDYFTLASLELTEAIKQKPDFIEPYLLLGEIHLRLKEDKKLESLLAKLNNSFPKDPKILILQIRKWINEKKYTETLELLENATALPPDLKFYQASLLILKNENEAAKKILEKLQLLPVEQKDFQITEEGIVSQNKEKIDQVSDVFAKKVSEFLVAIEEFSVLKEGKNAHYFAKLSKILSENNEAILAKEFAETSIKEDISYIDAWILRGYAEFLIRDYENALMDFRHAYELDPIRPEIHYFLALSLYESKNYDEAALFFEKSLEYQFEFSEEVRWKLIEIFAQQKKFDQVLKLYEELLDYNTKPESFVSAVHTAVDLVKKPEIALNFTQILIKKNPEDVFAMNIHAWALLANKKFLEAEKILKKALEIEPKNPRTFLNLGLLHEEKKEFGIAIEMYQKSYELGKQYKNFSSLINLAAEKYNELLAKELKPETPEASKVPEHSP